MREREIVRERDIVREYEKEDSDRQRMSIFKDAKTVV